VSTAERVQASDAFFLYVESPACPQLVGGVAILDTSAATPSRDELVGVVRAQLPRLPRFRQRLRPARWWRRPRWVEHPQLDWDRHVQVYEFAGRGRTLASGESGLAALVADIQATPLPVDRPMWRLVLVPGIGPDKAAAILIAHHAIADGFGTIMQAMRLLEGTDRARLPPLLAPPSRHSRWAARHRAWDVLAGLVQLATDGRPDRRLPSSAGSAPRFGMVNLPLAEVRELASRHGAGVTDVLAAAAAGALRRVSRHQVDELRIAVPLVARSTSSDPEGNITAGLIVNVPADDRREADRLAEVARRRVWLQSSSRVVASRFVVRWAGLLPVPMHGWFARTVYGGRYFHAIVTNIPGPDGQFKLAGSPVSEVYPIVPLAPGAPLAVGALSWNGALGIGLTVDPALADVQELCTAMVAVLHELAAPDPGDLSGRTRR
jgi:hypothetical protein